MRRVIFLILLTLTFCAPQKKIKIFLAGDSTLAAKLEKKRPETGWGEMLYLYFNDNVEIVNLARNGRSTRTFISEGRWQALVDSLQAGDYVLIQFGHNDESKKKLDRYTSPANFKNNLRRFVSETRSKSAKPILITPVMRRRFDDEGKFYDIHGEYPDLVRAVVSETGVHLVELHKRSEKLLIQLGKEKSKELFLWLEPGESPNYPEGKQDNTHFNPKGAKIIAGLVADEIRNMDLELSNYLKAD